MTTPNRKRLQISHKQTTTQTYKVSTLQIHIKLPLLRITIITTYSVMMMTIHFKLRKEIDYICLF